MIGTVLGQGDFLYDISWTSNPGDTAFGFSGEDVNTVINNKLGLRAGFDFDNDGNLEFLTSLQSSNEVPGRDNNLYLFEADGDNNYVLRWSYKVEEVAHQRNGLAVGDLDNNGNAEIIFVVDRLSEPTDNVFFFEYDPNLGNFPAAPTATWDTPRSEGGQFRCEVDLKVTDIDQDGQQEMILISFDGVVIASLASNDFTNPQFNEEYSNFEEMVWTFTTTIADLDNNGTNELITVGGWGLGGFNILEAIAPDFYLLNVNLDLSALPGSFGCYNAMTSADLDGNGFPEVYYADTGGNFRAFYTNGPYNSISESDFHLLASTGSEVLTIISDDSSFYVSTSAASEVFQIEYLGGDVADSLNYQMTRIYADKMTDPADITIFRIAGATDLDGDGKKDIVFATANHDSTRPTLFVIEKQTATGLAAEIGNQIPVEFRLEQNYPNPFNPTTTIEFNLPKEARISLKIYDARGREVKSLVENDFYFSGTHRLQWDATDNMGRTVASGVYVYRLISGKFSKSKTMSLIR
jgi:hypothetical protein